MRVALITDGIWPYVLGGMQKHSYYLCKYLAKNKVTVDLIHFNQSSYDIHLLEFFSEEEKKYIRPLVVDFPGGAAFPGAYIYRSYAYSKLVYDLVKDKLDSYNFIYTKGFTGWYLIKQKSRGAVRCAPVGVKFHGYEMFQKPPDFKSRLQQLILLQAPVKYVTRHADIVFSYGGKITKIIQSLGVEPKRIFELPSGVEQSALVTSVRSVTGKVKFVFLGRYERRKGVEELGEAINLLGKEGNNCEFHFIGPIPADKQINAANVIYHGEIRDKEILQNMLRQMDILLCPSWSEGLPNSILEAMGNGLTVMATDVGAVNVVVNSKTGWLIENSNPATITGTLSKILACKDSEINTRKQNALNLMREHFTWEVLINRFCDHFLH